MKVVLFYTVLLLSLVCTSEVVAQECPEIIDGGCPMVGSPWIHQGVDNTIAINRIISRSISANWLLDLRTPKRCYGGAPIYEENLMETCNIPAEDCYGGYCIDDYHRMIDIFAELNATLLFRTAGLHHQEHRLNPTDQNVRPYLIQMVKDINEAYDCAGNRRPVIQAVCLEGGSEMLNQTIIPRRVIDFFSDPNECPDCLDAASIESYADQDQTYYFDWEQMRFDGEVYFDIRKPLSQMWFYALCTSFIDFGFTGIDMGQYTLYGREDDNYFILERLYTDIRDYATHQCSFVLLTGENGADFPAAIGPSGRFLFDYNGVAIRPREYNSESEGSGDRGCEDSPLSFGAKEFWNEDFCKLESLPAVIDECNTGAYNFYPGTAWNDRPQLNGISSMAYFDWGPGEFVTRRDDPGNLKDDCFVDVSALGEISDAPGSCYGYNDTNYFVDVLDDDSGEEDMCKAEWWAESYCRMKSISQRTFIQAPGIIGLNQPSNACNLEYNDNLPVGSPEEDYLPVAGERFLLIDHPAIIEKIKEVWSPEEPQIQIEYDLLPFGCCRSGKNDPRPLTWNHVSISVQNPSCATTYSIHIKKPSGDWMPFVFGTRMSFLVPEDGDYRIFIRADNCGYQPNCERTYDYVRNWNRKVCASIFDQNCHKGYDLDETTLEGLAGDPSADLSGYSFVSTEHSVDFTQPTSFDVNVYPNPATGKAIKIEVVGHEGPIVTEIYDAGGSFVIAQNLRNSIGQVSLSGLVSGIYYMKVTAGNAVEYKRIIVQ